MRKIQIKNISRVMCSERRQKNSARVCCMFLRVFSLFAEKETSCCVRALVAWQPRSGVQRTLLTYILHGGGWSEINSLLSLSRVTAKQKFFPSNFLFTPSKHSTRDEKMRWRARNTCKKHQRSLSRPALVIKNTPDIFIKR